MVERRRVAGQAEDDRQSWVGGETIEMFEGEQVVVLFQIGRSRAPDIASAVSEKMHRLYTIVEILEDLVRMVFVDLLF